jgi:hypothetical protein
LQLKRQAKKIDAEFQLVVLDLDKNKRYPLIFVCVLPRYLRLLERRSSNFAKIFGERSVCTAKKLLIEAKHNEDDPDIQKVITKRIKEIETKPTLEPIMQTKF